MAKTFSQLMFESLIKESQSIQRTPDIIKMEENVQPVLEILMKDYVKKVGTSIKLDELSRHCAVGLCKYMVHVSRNCSQEQTD